MKRTEVQITVLRVPLSEQIQASFRYKTHRMRALVHLATDTRITSVDEIWINFTCWN